MGSWMPAVDVYETDSRVVIRVDLPGVNQADIDLRIEDGSLVLRGERKFASGEKQEDFLRIERSYGSFQRTFRLPGSVDPGQVQASHEDGVLEITAHRLPIDGDRTPEHEEYASMGFYRAFKLSEEIDAEKIGAALRDGVLTVTLPKSARVKPRKIEVKPG